MDFDEMQDRVEALVKLGGWSNTNPQPDFAFLVNEGLRILTRQTCHLVEDYTLNVIRGQVDYDLADADDPRQWIAFNNDASLNDGQTWIPQTTRDNLRVQNPRWRTVDSSQVQAWYWSGQQTIGLFPPPSASGDTIGFQGPRHEVRLVENSDTPVLAEDFHEGICLYGAWHWGKLYARGNEREVVAGYLAEADDYVFRAKNAMATQDAGLVVRRVSRPATEYLNNGPMVPAIFWPQ